MADRGHLDERVAGSRIGAGQTRSTRDAEHGFAARYRPHPSVLAPDLLLVAGGVVHFGIEVIAAQDGSTGREVIVGERIWPDKIGRRIVALNLLRDRVNAIARDFVSRKG